MAVCSELLSRGYRDLLDQNGKQLIDLILSGARAGQALTRALLTYARTVGTSTLPKLPVPLGEVLDQALAGIKSSVQETGASITRDELPVVTGDRILLAQLLQNLLENAVKYRREVAPVIHVGCQRRGAEWIISVKDNGLGVPHAQYQRIFEPFQRLRSAKILGSGLGLATCKRIVERHGGSIWVESEPGQGSTFYFTIPAM
jgi:light-regulated signal transduction histidine kinase (bacteriophytochrome)